MKIGIILEGEGEIAAIEAIVRKLDLLHDIIQRPLRADLQPKASPKVIARSANRAVTLCRSRGVQRVVVLIDAEDHRYPIGFARELENAFHELYNDTKMQFRVVVKQVMVENWLIADVLGLKQMVGRFDVTAAFEKAVAPNRADSVVEPIALLNSIAKKKEYRKGDDPLAISLKVDALRASINSRSFRKFLREIGSKVYQRQSKLPYDSPRLLNKRKA